MNPWVILAAVLAFLGVAAGGVQYGAHQQKTADDLALEKERNEANAAATKAAAEYFDAVAEQRDRIESLRGEIATKAEQFEKDLAAARSAAEPITREVIRYVAAKPLDRIACALPADLLGLRNAQIRAANAAARGEPPAAPGGGLPSELQAPAAGNSDR